MTIDRPTAIAIILFTVLLLLFFLVVPKYNEFRDFQIKVAEKQGEFDSKFAYYSEVGRISRELDLRKDSIAKIDTALPEDVYFAPLVYFFQKKGMESGLIVKKVFLTKAAAINPDSNIKEIVFSLNVVGSYNALKNFISSLEKSARLIELSSISFSSSTSLAELALSPGQETYTFALEIKTNSY